VIGHSGQSFEALFSIAPLPQCFVQPSSCMFRKARVLAVESRGMGVGSLMETLLELSLVDINYYLVLNLCSCKSWLESLIGSFRCGRSQQPEKADCPVISS
jgi:hypothetical protein